MHDVIPDLWPDEIRSEVPTPLAILRIQANNLQTKTKGIIQAEVRTLTDHNKKREIYRFELVAPAMEGYTFRLFSAEHQSKLVYPVVLEWDGFEHGSETASTPDELYPLLKMIFQSDATKSTLMSLIAQSNEQRQDAE